MNNHNIFISNVTLHACNASNTPITSAIYLLQSYLKLIFAMGCHFVWRYLMHDYFILDIFVTTINECDHSVVCWLVLILVEVSLRSIFFDNGSKKNENCYLHCVTALRAPNLCMTQRQTYLSPIVNSRSLFAHRHMLIRYP